MNFTLSESLSLTEKVTALGEMEPELWLTQTSPLMTDVKPLLTAEWNTEVTEGYAEGKYSLTRNPQLEKSR